MLREHFNTEIETNPLEIVLNEMLEVGDIHPLSIWGQRELNMEMFNISDRETFGLGLQEDILGFFNVCGCLFKAQARWWKSNLCRYVWSDIIDNTIKYMEEKC